MKSLGFRDSMKTDPCAFRVHTNHRSGVHTSSILSNFLIHSIHIKSPIIYKPIHHWDVGGNQRTQRKPTQSQGKHANSTRTYSTEYKLPWVPQNALRPMNVWAIAMWCRERSSQDNTHNKDQIIYFSGVELASVNIANLNRNIHLYTNPAIT